MPVLSRMISIPLRIGEIAFAAVVAGIIGSYMDRNSSSDNWPHARFIYTIVVAAISMLLGVIWLIPFSRGFFTWAVDIFLSLCWFAAFGLLVQFTRGSCDARAFDWNGITRGGTCNRWRAVQAFAFLSAVFWLTSAIVGIWFTRRERRKVAVDAPYVEVPTGL
ncbi:uncharacterized protein HMPREF1541_03635 [Cyphellophora europaea CBS 101466]|uniref:MARVEL domain-containing protein n=1 Tax=Cyphellophora europaea (strain CBS 101466) TaxID=1220924 RepID=W2S152_CYPE1|nr:uncharacterized protein HMPREF1541_03635 [Cyphellophora europaea CBS 101466]ETN41699.1 hypothetical protein HMPREF1541_03635 [Cyphellophora europaea CBS 101466]